LYPKSGSDDAGGDTSSQLAVEFVIAPKPADRIAAAAAARGRLLAWLLETNAYPHLIEGMRGEICAFVRQSR